MKKRNFLCTTMLVMMILLLCSPGLFAEDTAASDVIVDEENETVKFIYRENGEDFSGVFSDIPDNAWYNLYVSYLKQIDLVNGISETEFAPQQNITRGEFIKLISLLSAENIESNTVSVSFADGDVNNWYHPFEEWAAHNGIAEGDSQNNFNGNEFITREEAVAMLYRFSQSHGSDIFDGNTPVTEVAFDDESQISPWAAEAVKAMTEVGVIAGYENQFRPQDYISRAEAAKVVSVYRIFDQRPTILNEDGSSLEYLDIEEAPFDESLIEETGETAAGYTGEVNVIGDVPDTVTEEEHGITASWATTDHPRMLRRSFSLLAKDNQNGNTPVYVNNLSNSLGSGTLLGGGKLSINAQGYIEEGSMAPDENETTNRTFVRHYYKYDPNGGVGTTKVKDDYGNYIHTDTAYHWFNEHYYWAKCDYSVGNYAEAYREVGRSIHYLEDINAPHHASLHTTTNSNHKEYESWVKNHFYSEYLEYGSAGSSYSYMCNNTFLAISNNFSHYACDRFTYCDAFQSNETGARNATGELTKKTQRAVAGLLYRFLVDTGRAN